MVSSDWSAVFSATTASALTRSDWSETFSATTFANDTTELPTLVRVAGTFTAATSQSILTSQGWVPMKRRRPTGTVTPPPPPPPPPPTEVLVPELPWAMPTRAFMRATGRDVLAYFHTFPTWPEPDYTSWLLPSSAPSIGGKWRQRPFPIINTTSPTTTQRRQWALDDITKAANIGVDGFTMNILTGYLGGDSRWTNLVLNYYDSAAQFSAENDVGFTICPNISMLSVVNNNGDPTVWADAVQPLLAHSAAYKRGGRPVVFHYNADNEPVSWYRTFHARLLNTHGINAALVLSHQASSPTGNGNMDNYLPLFTDGLAVALHPWNSPTYTTAVSSIYTTWRDWCRANNVTFCGTAGPRWENDRPEDLKQIEGFGARILQRSWQSSINNSDPMFQITSWSDHLESHNIRPSTGYQWAPYDITAYYLAWYKTGTAPTITQDAVFYFHRMHLGGAAYSTSSQTLGAYNVTSGPPVDRVITTVFLTAPADVYVTTGGVERLHAAVPAGVSTLDDPMFANDTPSFRVRRSGVDVVPVFSSAFTTRSGIVYQDLLYRMGSSTRAAISGVQNNLPQDR